MAAEAGPSSIRVKVGLGPSAAIWVKVGPTDTVGGVATSAAAKYNRAHAAAVRVMSVSWDGCLLSDDDAVMDFLSDKDTLVCEITGATVLAPNPPPRAAPVTTSNVTRAANGAGIPVAPTRSTGGTTFSLRYRTPVPIHAAVKTLGGLSATSTLQDVERAVAASEGHADGTQRFMLYSALGYAFVDGETGDVDLATHSLESWGIRSGDIVFAIPYDASTRDGAAYNEATDSALDHRALGSSCIFVKNHQSKTRTLMVNLDKHTVHDVKRMMFKLEGIKPSLQRMYYASRPLRADVTLSSLGVSKESTLEMRNLPVGTMTSGWQGSFAMGTTQPSSPQSDAALSLFWSTLYVVAAEMHTSDDRDQVLGHVLALTRFPPLVRTLAILFRRECISFSGRLAVLETLYQLFRSMVPLDPSTAPPTTLVADADTLTNSVDCWAYIIANASEDTHPIDILHVSLDCGIANCRLEDPVLVPGCQGAYSRATVMGRIADGSGMPGCTVSPLTAAALVPADVYALLCRSATPGAPTFTLWTPQRFEVGFQTSGGGATATNAGTTSSGGGGASGGDGGLGSLDEFAAWNAQVGAKLAAGEPQPPPRMPGKTAWKALRASIGTGGGGRALDFLRIRKALELRRWTAPRLARDLTGLVVVHCGRSKHVDKTATLFAPRTGKSTDESPDTLAAAAGPAGAGGGGARAALGIGEWGITPKEAIVVVLDVSSSMNSDSGWGDGKLSRMDTVKILFDCFVDRTLAYQLPHVAGLILFGDDAKEECPITEAIDTFMKRVRDTEANGCTALHDAIVLGVTKLLEVRRVYKSCDLRILALTDGDDNSSSATADTAARLAQKNKVTVDSVIINDHPNKKLHAISIATGGACFNPRSHSDATRIFELETMLCVRDRKATARTTAKAVVDSTEALLAFADGVPFTTRATLERVRPKDLEGAVTSAASLLRREAALSQTTVAAGAAGSASAFERRRRVMRELVKYTRHPHPSITICPVETDLYLWRVLVEGPSGTPYAGGVFLAYLEFGPEYPAVAPELRFETPLIHCNVNSQGKVCHSIFARNWSRSTTVSLVLNCVYGLLLAPEPDDPLDTGLAELFLSNRAEYDRQATESTARDASKTVAQWLAQFSVDPADSIETPSTLRCPLTGKLFTDPVSARGEVYDRAAIVAYIDAHGTHPGDNRPLTRAELYPSRHTVAALAEHRKLVSAVNAMG